MIVKGTIPRAPLGKMPLIDRPFKKEGCCGPHQSDTPPSDYGRRFVLTLVDYATRYPEAVPLKSVSTEEVAEASVNTYSRLGLPEEILTDMGKQFTSEFMCEVSRLLSIEGAGSPSDMRT